MAMAFTYVAGFLFNIVLCFCMGDPAAILASPIEQPVAQIFYNSLGPAGGVVFTVCALIILQFVCFTAMQALGRTVFAFSRDRLVPFGQVWTAVNARTQTPLCAVWISVFWCIVINLIGLGSYTAILGVFNITAIALDWSYIIPIFCKLVFRRFEPGPWNMGRAGYVVNAWACIWTLFVSIIFVMPSDFPAKSDTMNYAIVFLAFILLVSLVWWWVHGRKFYTGPIVQATIEGEGMGMANGEEAPVFEKGVDWNPSEGSWEGLTVN